MLALINRILDWFKSLFWKEEMELTLVGLQHSGKTTFVNVIAVSCLFLSISNIYPYLFHLMDHYIQVISSFSLVNLSRIPFPLSVSI